MKAITYNNFGNVDVLSLTDAPEPSVPGTGVVVDMRFTSVNVIDTRSRQGLLFPLVNKNFPKIPGADVAGVVSKVGASADAFKIGDRVFGATNPFRGGAFAEKVAIDQSALAKIPDSVNFESAATLPIAGLAALYSLRELGQVNSSSRVLIYGSSGATGLYAIQLAKFFGAHVTSVCGSGGISTCKDMGANVTIDYKRDPVKLSGPYDIVIDYSSKFTFTDAKPHLSESGRYIESSPTIPKVIGSSIANLFRKQKNLMLMTSAKSKDLAFLADLVENGKIRVTIAKTYSLADSREAFVEQERGGIVGKIIVFVG